MTTLPERFEEFADARRQGFIRMKELKDNGGKLCGTFCQFAPSEMIDAAGLYRVGLCGQSPEPIPAAEAELPANLCPLIKSSYGFALTETCPYAYFSDLIVGETTCDGKKKMYEILAELKDVHIIHLPNNPDPERSLESWIMELRHFKEVLEKKFDVTITDEMLREAIKWGNKERIQMAQLYELGRYDPPAITGLHMRSVMEGVQYIFDRKERYEKVQEVLDKCEEDWRNGKGPIPKGSRRPRILVSGGPSGGVFEKTIKVIEELGGVIVCYEGCSGIVSRRRLIEESETKDPIECIAEKYLEVPCAVMSPNQRRLEQVALTIDEWKVDGVVGIILHSCNPFGIESTNIKNIANQCGKPYLHLETNYGQGDEGQLRTRIEAFLEML
ncbi:double-cubane-cluster-containing anaerobic reductase [Tissierella carlieri]|uniref:Double-cubane-cluster-containing anaerobic reductase n=1 Tax=Tissierella carlieri TaxID=689904 RepID=A0ABT1SBQ4_9FIRM|nr:double-cubane-cluster-containing anaerobic reductase [Tissierella carlieri]MCQ4923908.1 double-cubane-cluster-containing anaerobic reductase [Tissierella carlieri]MDU5082581.1 double-cubane-cluster-containing anaerobic reductase [Bacillota bacterium]